MRKAVFGRQLGRSKKTREALFKSLIRDFIGNGRLTTTFAKAKAIQSDIEKLITIAKRKKISDLRLLRSKIGNSRKLSQDFASKTLSLLKDSVGGYTKIIPLTKRLGDGAQMARLEWSHKVDDKIEKKKSIK